MRQICTVSLFTLSCLAFTSAYAAPSKFAIPNDNSLSNTPVSSRCTTLECTNYIPHDRKKPIHPSTSPDANGDDCCTFNSVACMWTNAENAGHPFDPEGAPNQNNFFAACSNANITPNEGPQKITYIPANEPNNLDACILYPGHTAEINLEVFHGEQIPGCPVDDIAKISTIKDGEVISRCEALSHTLGPRFVDTTGINDPNKPNMCPDQ